MVLIHRAYTRFQCYVHRRHISTIFRHAMRTPTERPFTAQLAIFPVISGTNDKKMIITDLIWMKKIVDFACFSINEIIQAILGLWREGAPANRATRLLTRIPLFHATHLTGTVSGLRRLSSKWPSKETIWHLILASCTDAWLTQFVQSAILLCDRSRVQHSGS